MTHVVNEAMMKFTRITEYHYILITKISDGSAKNEQYNFWNSC